MSRWRDYPPRTQNVLETLRIYDDPDDRYVVSLIVSYSEAVLDAGGTAGSEDVGGGASGEIGERVGASSVLDQAVAKQPDKMKAAALAALDLTRDAGSRGTRWYVYDRLTGTGRLITQSDFDTIPFDLES